MRRILVTGANGQLGHAFKEAAKDITDDFEWIFAGRDELDITDGNSVKDFFKKERPKVIINCAAYTDVDKAETERDKAFLINYDGAVNLSEAASLNGAWLIHISTDYVFNGLKDTPYNESDIPSPINTYGESKLTGTRAVLESGCRGAIIRTSLLYSPWERNFVKTILDIAGKTDRINVVYDQRCCPTSSLSLARAVIGMLPALLSKTGAAEVYHYCDSGVASRSEFASEIIKQAGLNCRVAPVTSDEFPGPARRPEYSAMDTSKFTRDFGVVPPHWKEALAECIRQIADGR